MSEKPAPPSPPPASPPARVSPRRARRKPDQDEISTRAYFIHLEEGGGDQLANWLRAERELTAA